MTDYNELSANIRKIAWGYVFILFDINIATVSILPKWAGYLMIISALPVLAKEVSSAKLLKPLGAALTVDCVAEWVMKIFSINYSLMFISVLLVCIRIYFNFQLFTNLAEVAEKYSCSQKKSLLNLRTAITVMDVIISVVMLVVRISTDNDDFTYFIPIAMVIVQLIMMISICVNIFSLAKSLENYPDTPDISAGTPVVFPSEAQELFNRTNSENKTDSTR